MKQHEALASSKVLNRSGNHRERITLNDLLGESGEKVASAACSEAAED